MQVLTPIQYAQMEIASFPYRADMLAMCDALAEQVS